MVYLTKNKPNPIIKNSSLCKKHLISFTHIHFLVTSGSIAALKMLLRQKLRKSQLSGCLVSLKLNSKMCKKYGKATKLILRLIQEWKSILPLSVSMITLQSNKKSWLETYLPTSSILTSRKWTSAHLRAKLARKISIDCWLKSLRHYKELCALELNRLQLLIYTMK